MYYEKSKIADKDNPINITYDELLHKTDVEVDMWVDELRDYVITQWEDNAQPPVIGQNKNDIIKNWKKLLGYDVKDFFDKKTKVIKNFNKFASGVNQFFPTMLKTKISTGVSSDNATSIYDYFKEDDLRDKFKKAMLRGLYKDSMYSFGKSVKKKEMGVPTEEFIEYFNNNEKQGIMIMRMNNSVPVSSSDTEYLVLSSSEVIELKNKKIITDQNLRTINNIENSYKLKNGDIRYNWYWVRLYNRQQRIFPTALQIFRLGLGQPAVNFPALTARFLYEHFTENIKGDVIVYDPSAGWGGRILGAMCTNRTLHYIGTDPNPDNVGRYENVAEFYNTHCNQDNRFWGDREKNTYSVFTNGSEEIYNNSEFRKYEGQVDFVFTSPPYFNREQYSQDDNQSFKKFSAYEDWRDNFLRPTLTTAYKMLKDDRYICWNIADIKVGSNKPLIPLEQDSIDILKDLGCTYEGKLKMLMTKMIGLNPKQGKNSVEINGNYFKFEPILVFRKG